MRSPVPVKLPSNRGIVTVNRARRPCPNVPLSIQSDLSPSTSSASGHGRDRGVARCELQSSGDGRTAGVIKGHSIPIMSLHCGTCHAIAVHFISLHCGALRSPHGHETSMSMCSVCPVGRLDDVTTTVLGPRQCNASMAANASSTVSVGISVSSLRMV